MTDKTEFRYDFEEDILCIDIKKDTVDSLCFGNIIIDFDRYSNVTSIEILNATTFFKTFELTKNMLSNLKSASLSERKDEEWINLTIVLELKDRKIRIEKEIAICMKEGLNETSWCDFDIAVKKIYNQIYKYCKKNNKKYEYVYAPTRGGLVLGVVLANLLNAKIVKNEEEYVQGLIRYDRLLVVNDIADRRSNKILKEFEILKEVESDSDIQNDIQIAVLHYNPKSETVPDFYGTKLSIKDSRDVLYPWEKEHDDVIEDDVTENNNENKSD